MSYSWRVAWPRSVTGACPPTGKKLSKTRPGVRPATARTTIATPMARTMSVPAMRGPAPVRDREGIDIGSSRVGAGPRRGPGMRRLGPSEDAHSVRGVPVLDHTRRPLGGAAGRRPAGSSADRGQNGHMPGRRARLLPAAAGVLLAVVSWLGAAGGVLAHGGVVPSEPPSVANLLLGWSFDPLVWLPAIAALLAWRMAVSSVNRAHPANPVAPRRTWSWVAGVVVLLVALDSGIATYDTTLFSVHMVQHLLLTLVAPPLLLYAGPIVLLLRVSSPATRRRWILPALHSRFVRFLSFPVVAWLLFAGVMWGSHFSSLFDASLENEWAHRFEHGLYLFAALVFWWPVCGPDPSPWRLRPSVRVLYTGMQMPQNTFLALAIYSAAQPLYSHYVTTVRSWGPTPLEDQQAAGGIMWLGGDLLFLAAIILLVYAWIQDDERRMVSEDRRLDAERAAIREREVKLAARRAAEAGESRQGVASRVSAPDRPGPATSGSSRAPIPASDGAGSDATRSEPVPAPTPFDLGS